MFPMVSTALVAVLFTVSCFHGMPIDETEIPRSPSDRDNYKEEREVRSASTPLPIFDILLNITMEMQKNASSEEREEVISSTTSILRQTKSGSDRAKDVSSKMRRDAFWLPLWIKQGFWTPSPTEGSPYNYDGYLGKVRRDAPIPLSSTTSSPSKIFKVT